MEKKKFITRPTSRFDEIMKKWKTMSKDERDEFRDEINTRTMFSRCQEINKDQLEDAEALDVGDFIILRFLLDEKKDYNHDHLAFIKEKYFIFYCKIFLLISNVYLY